MESTPHRSHRSHSRHYRGHHHSSRVRSHLIPAILATLLCCMPFGIVSIVYASRVDALVRVGDLYSAQEASEKALLWLLMSVGLGALIYVFFFIVGASGPSWDA